jgi:crossover junction endodeoxyribonuclease RuvC
MIIGADPGTKGAIAALGVTLHAWRLPTEPVKVNRKERDRLDPVALYDLVRDLAMLAPRFVVLEKVNGYGGQSGSTGFVFGRTYGLLELAFVAAGIPIRYVTPSAWKADMRCPGDKNLARARATELFPAHAHLWKRKSDDGLAEAAMLAEWGRQSFA